MFSGLIRTKAVRNESDGFSRNIPRAAYNRPASGFGYHNSKRAAVCRNDRAAGRSLRKHELRREVAHERRACLVPRRKREKSFCVDVSVARTADASVIASSIPSSSHSRCHLAYDKLGDRKRRQGDDKADHGARHGLFRLFDPICGSARGHVLRGSDQKHDHENNSCKGDHGPNQAGDDKRQICRNKSGLLGKRLHINPLGRSRVPKRRSTEKKEAEKDD